ncbi:unnamed protein product [Linum trigynum]|uniref:Uncharacterized protein n=1 Tax=Linum trigynum TaxID=586398 RepID=A0AAV2DR29_9ROSI
MFSASRSASPSIWGRREVDLAYPASGFDECSSSKPRSGAAAAIIATLSLSAILRLLLLMLVPRTCFIRSLNVDGSEF